MNNKFAGLTQSLYFSQDVQNSLNLEVTVCQKSPSAPKGLIIE